MTDERSNYAGPAAAAVFLVGLLIVGNTAVRIAVAGVIVFAVSLGLSNTRARRFLIWAIAVAACSGLVAHRAATSELTGSATYFNGHGRWFLGTELVTREGAPAKFRQAANEAWAATLFFTLISATCFIFYRKLKSAEYDPNL